MALIEKPSPGSEEAPPRPDPGPGQSGWTGGRVTSLVLGVILSLVSLGALSGSGFLWWADRTQRDAAGFITSSAEPFRSTGYAVTSDRIQLWVGHPSWLRLERAFGDARIRVTPESATTPVFVGVAQTVDVQRYLRGVAHTVVFDVSGGRADRTFGGGAPSTPPAQQRFWEASTQGVGQSSLRWHVRSGDWTIVTMNADAHPGVSILADVGITVPSLPWVALGLLVFGLVLLALGLPLIVVPIVRASRVRG